jgi:predicted transcriptional regulator
MALPDMSTDWATALSKFMAKEAAPAPEGWVTAEQAAKLWKVSRVYANRMLTRMIRSGAVERKRYAVQIKPKKGGQMSRAYLRNQPHYRLLKTAKS